MSSVDRPLPQFIGEVEALPSFVPRPQITHVVFDFDGTLSWVRHGWPEIMFSVFRRNLPLLDGETAEARTAVLDSIVFGMNGKPTILQMQRFTEVVRERGGGELVAEDLRREFQDQLDAEIAARLLSIRSRAVPHDTFVVFAARALLERLREIGVTPIVLSSSIEHRVKEEAEALGLTEYFGRHIYGSSTDPTTFSKMAVFQRLLKEEGIQGEHLLSFGDGPVEIAATKELGGLAIAVCSDENHNGSGVIDPIKRSLLAAAGADAVVPDFRDAIALVDYLLQK
jgi:FMN phosphatase YigB (HAD superfamily)